MNIDTALRLAVPLVHDAEGFRGKAYLDTLAKPPRWTIGYGTTLIAGKPVCAGMTCTPDQAALWAAADLRDRADQVLHIVKVPLTDGQLAALTSLNYNLGIGKLRETSLIADLNVGLYRAAANQFLEFDHAGGVQYNGLTRRRQRERALFLTGLDPAPVPPPAPAQAPVTADDLNLQEITRLRAG